MSPTPRTLRHAITYPRLPADAYLVIEAGDDLAIVNVPACRARVGRGFTAAPPSMPPLKRSQPR